MVFTVPVQDAHEIGGRIIIFMFHESQSLNIYSPKQQYLTLNGSSLVILVIQKWNTGSTNN